MNGTPVDEPQTPTQVAATQLVTTLTQVKSNTMGSLTVKSLDSSLLNSTGKSILAECYALGLERLPVALEGPTGMGKSSLMRLLAEALGKEYKAINCQPGMNIDDLFGAPFPVNGPNGMAVEFRDGVLTYCVRNGLIFLLEELTMAPPEAMARFHGILDNGFRSLSLPESEEREVPVHDEFWFVTTYNPSAKGYAASKLTKPIVSRFAATFDLSSPIVDEQKMLRSKGMATEDTTKVLRFATELRKNPDTYMSTRDLALLADVVRAGFTLDRAIEIGVAPKFQEHKAGILTTKTQFFGGK